MRSWPRLLTCGTDSTQHLNKRRHVTSHVPTMFGAFLYGLGSAAALLSADDTSSASSLTLLRSRGGVAATTRMDSHLVRVVDEHEKCSRGSFGDIAKG